MVVTRAAAEVADEPVARAGLGRDIDRDGEQALAADHDQRAQPEHPGGEPGRDGADPAAASPLAASPLAASPLAASTAPGRRHIPAVHRDLHRPGAGHQAGRHRQAAHGHEVLGAAVAIGRAQKLSRPVPQDFDRITDGMIRRALQVQVPGADGGLQVRHRVAQVSEEHAQVPVRTRRGQRHLPRSDQGAHAKHVADRADQQPGRARWRVCHAYIDRVRRRFSPVISLLARRSRNSGKYGARVRSLRRQNIVRVVQYHGADEEVAYRGPVPVRLSGRRRRKARSFSSGQVSEHARPR